MEDLIRSRIQEILLRNDAGVRVFIKREDEIHPFISGNKYRKLKYNILEAKVQNHKTLLTFGGAFSNHIAALAFAGKKYGFRTVGVVRGDELKQKTTFNPTLRFAQKCGMSFHFVSREQYRDKEEVTFLNALKSTYGEYYLIPEGGTNSLAIKGCEEILNPEDGQFDFICCSAGTGGTVSGLINATQKHQKVIGFSALKGDFLNQDIRKFAKKNNWELSSDYHFGGYAKMKNELVAFINDFKQQYNVPLDPIYTGKMVFGVFDLIKNNYFPEGSKILMVHSGGLQGIAGMNEILKSKNKPQIHV